MTTPKSFMQNFKNKTFVRRKKGNALIFSVLFVSIITTLVFSSSNILNRHTQSYRNRFNDFVALEQAEQGLECAKYMMRYYDRSLADLSENMGNGNSTIFCDIPLNSLSNAPTQRKGIYTTKLYTTTISGNSYNYFILPRDSTINFPQPCSAVYIYLEGTVETIESYGFSLCGGDKINTIDTGSTYDKNKTVMRVIKSVAK